ncbi:MAG: hypothetical protein JSV64_00950 [Candidatus Bathyarchaeota archaeon]|nr:MAG: hypothetical protein JSV64_00950 [Candidatus Bathyarchaeota archaeon]
MKIKILSQKRNPLLKREEVAFEVDHSQEGQTSSRLHVRRNLASALKTKPEFVFLERLETRTGTMIAAGEANIYDTIEQAELIELKHIVSRQSPPQQPEDEEKSKKEDVPEPKTAEKGAGEAPSKIEEDEKDKIKEESSDDRAE